MLNLRLNTQGANLKGEDYGHKLRGMFKSRILVSLALPIFLAIFVCPLARAQDYPYQDDPTNDGNLPVEKPVGKKDTTTGKIKPTRLPALLKLGIKVGGNFTSIQSASTVAGQSVTTHGFGGEALFAMGWDLPYQPVFIEFESGYRGLFMSEGDPLHVIVLGLGLHYRNRIGRTSLWKPGLKTYIEFRIQDTSDETTGQKSTDFSVAPTVALSSLFEFDSFLIEPLFFLNRIQSQRNFYGAAFRVGYRF